jgi:hypothetical protein
MHRSLTSRASTTKPSICVEVWGDFPLIFLQLNSSALAGAFSRAAFSSTVVAQENQLGLT